VLADAGKQIRATVELASDVRGPMDTGGGYVISVVSVSTWDKALPAA